MFDEDSAPFVVDGAPVDDSTITPLQNPKANSDTIFYSETLSATNPLNKKSDKNDFSTLPCRLTFLTPGGKRTVEAKYSELRDSQGGLKNVHKSVQSLLEMMKLVRVLDIKNSKAFPLPYNITTSEYVWKKNGVNRYLTPEKPLSFPSELKPNNKPPSL